MKSFQSTIFFVIILSIPIFSYHIIRRGGDISKIPEFLILIIILGGIIYYATDFYTVFKKKK